MFVLEIISDWQRRTTSSKAIIQSLCTTSPSGYGAGLSVTRVYLSWQRERHSYKQTLTFEKSIFVHTLLKNISLVAIIRMKEKTKEAILS